MRKLWLILRCTFGWHNWLRYSRYPAGGVQICSWCGSSKKYSERGETP